MAITASQLRQNVYRLLDEVLSSGLPLEIERNGQLLRITPVTPPDRLARVRPVENLVTGDAGDLTSLDWSSAWQP